MNIERPKNKSLWYDAVRNVFKEKKEVYSLAENLKKNGYKIGFLSNTEIPATKYFFEKEYHKYFDGVIFSCIEKSVKPEKKIYLLALEKLGSKPEETIFIDDKQKYVEGARNVGINSILFKDIENLKKDLVSYKVKID